MDIKALFVKYMAWMVDWSAGGLVPVPEAGEGFSDEEIAFIASLEDEAWELHNKHIFS